MVGNVTTDLIGSRTKDYVFQYRAQISSNSTDLGLEDGRFSECPGAFGTIYVASILLVETLFSQAIELQKTEWMQALLYSFLMYICYSKCICSSCTWAVHGTIQAASDASSLQYASETMRNESAAQLSLKCVKPVHRKNMGPWFQMVSSHDRYEIPLGRPGSIRTRDLTFAPKVVGWRKGSH